MGASLFAPAPTPFSRFARVVLERGIDHPEGLTYGVPDSLGPLAVGDRVEAPLGRADASASGYVFEVMTEPGLDPSKIKPIRRRTGVGLPPTLVALAEWIARYYCTPLGMTLAAMVPAAVKRAAGVKTLREIEPTGAPLPEGAKLTPALRAALDSLGAIDPALFPMAPRAAADLASLRTIGPVNRLIALGLFRTVERRVVRAVWDDRPLPADTTHALTGAQSGAVGAIADSLGAFRVHLLRGVTGSGKTEVYLRALQAAIERGERAIVLVPEISLTPQTVGRFLARFQGPSRDRSSAGAPAIAILHSGLSAAQRSQQWSAVASGDARIVIGARSAIFAPFPGGAGARLGLIIVDEEHEDGYKQDQLPRYHARDVAIKRAQLEGCPVVLGSATPSLESWRHATEGKYTLLELPERVGGAVLPRVEIVDLAEERRARPWTDQRVHLLGPRLEAAIERTLNAGHQVILLLNRRGWGNYICCPDHRCGWVMACDSCDAPMVFHKPRLPAGDTGPASFVRCHHCLAERTLPKLCPICSRRVTVFGMGTQRVEEELSRIFPQLVEGETMLRLDGDSIGAAGAGKKWFDALDRFARREVRLLLGTQMIAKGLDFPGVRLVGVVNADTALNLPDFRSAERTFQLVSQVAGRAGRPRPPAAAAPPTPGAPRDADDLVLVQTFAPSAAPIILAAAHDYRAFGAEELALRRQAGLPPYTRMARIVIRDRSLDKVRAHANQIETALRHAIDAGGAPDEPRAHQTAPAPPPNERGTHASGAASRPAVRIRGPMPCPIARVNEFHRLAIELTARSGAELQRVITHARNRGLLKSDDRTAVDIDPMALM